MLAMVGDYAVAWTSKHLQDPATSRALAVDTSEKVDRSLAVTLSTRGGIEEIHQALTGLPTAVAAVMPQVGPGQVPSGAWAAAAAHATADTDFARRAGLSVLEEWDPHILGVHDAIRTADTPQDAGLPMYIPRPHDQVLQGLLQEVAEGRSGSVLVVLSGSSCAGKSRSMWQAVADVLPRWPVIAPANQQRLLDLLREGIPGPAVIWLDELHQHGYLDLAREESGLVAEALLELLSTSATTLEDGREGLVGPYVVLASLWPTHLTQLRTPPAGLRDDPAGSRRRDAVHRLLSKPVATVVTVPDDFREAAQSDLAAAAAADPRVRAVQATSGGPSRITQVLAGGTTLLARWHADCVPDTESPVEEGFTPSQAAVLTAAADLYRIGLTSVIPHPILTAAAEDYLTDRAWARPGWIDQALTELTQATDEHLYGRHDIAMAGPPPLTVAYPAGTDPTYLLHDYLTQHHLICHDRRSTRACLWEAVTSHQHLLDEDTRTRIADNASHRGLYTTTRILTNHQLAQLAARADTGDWSDRYRLAVLLAARGDIKALMVRADAGDPPAQRLLADLLTARGDVKALTARADAGDRPAGDRLVYLLADRGDVAALRARADTGDEAAQRELTALLTARGGMETLTVRANISDEYARSQLSLLRELVDGGSTTAVKALIGVLLADRGFDLASEAELTVDGGLVVLSPH